MSIERKGVMRQTLVEDILPDPAPRHSPLGRSRIAASQEHLKLVRFQAPRSASLLRCRPEPEPPRRETLLTKPEALAVVDQYLHRLAPTIAENKYGAGHGVGMEFLAADPAQPVDAAAEIRRLDRHQNAHVGGELDHDITLAEAPGPVRPHPLRRRRARERATSAPLRARPPEGTPPQPAARRMAPTQQTRETAGNRRCRSLWLDPATPCD